MTVLFLLLYPLFVIQAGLGQWSPDFLLLTVVSTAIADDRTRAPASGRLFACGLGACAGFLLDLTMPGAFGLNLFTLAVVGYGTAAIVGVTWRTGWIAFPLITAALVLRLLLYHLLRIAPPAGPFLVGSGLTLLFTLPWLAGVRWIYRLARPAGPRAS